MGTRVFEVIKSSGIEFGTSGARGLVSDFSPLVCTAFTQSFLEALEKKYLFDTIVIGIDNRPSSPQIADFCIKAVKDFGKKVIFSGVLPTPALAYFSQKNNLPCIMVTGSHIPFDRNGLKFYTPDGEISKDDESIIVNATSFLTINEGVSSERVRINQSPALMYIDRYISLFDGKPLAGLKLGIYEHSSAGRDLYSTIFESLGAHVTCLERTDHFVPIDTEAVSDADSLKAQNWSKEHDFDVIFTTDGDGDRPLIADENGDWVKGDVLGLLCSEFLSIQALAVPVSCNSSIEISGFFNSVVRTKIGSPYVIENMVKLCESYSRVAGFEANGGYLLGSSINLGSSMLSKLDTRDAVLPALCLMLLSLSKQRSISSLVSSVSVRYTSSNRLKGVHSETSNNLIAQAYSDPELFLTTVGFNVSSIEEVNNLDGLRIKFNDSEIVHLRPSGNAPELRCYSESSSLNLADEYVNKVLSYVEMRLK